MADDCQMELDSEDDGYVRYNQFFLANLKLAFGVPRWYAVSLASRAGNRIS